MNVGCIIHGGPTSSSIGSRVYFNWRGQMLWQHAYNTAREITNEIVVVGVDIEEESTRQKTIAKALAKIKSERVIIFDLSTPLVNSKHLKALQNLNEPCGTFVLPINKAMYSTSSRKHFDDSSLYIVQGPQMFDTKMLKEAYKKTTIEGAREDTSIFKEVHDIEPVLVPGNVEFLYELSTHNDIRVIDMLAA